MLRTRPYDRAAYRRMRRARLKENPVCELCNRAPSTEVHHLEPLRMGGDPLQWSNLVACCKACHAAETRRHRQIYGW